MTTSPASFADEVLERVRSNLEEVRRRITSTGRDLEGVRLVAVTKTFDVDVVNVAWFLGLRSFGENYVEELCTKREASDAREGTWHYLGALQSNKIGRAVRCAEIVSGVSRLKEIDRIAALSPGHLVDVQVNFTESPGRNGATPSEVGGLVRAARERGLRARGLMVVAPLGAEETRRAFALTRALCDDLGLEECSMGMSDDLELACEAGTTEVRLGRALFGPRVSRGALA